MATSPATVLLELLLQEPLRHLCPWGHYDHTEPPENGSTHSQVQFINFNHDHKEEGLKDTTTFTFLVKVVSGEKWLKAIELAQLYFYPMIFRRGNLK